MFYTHLKQFKVQRFVIYSFEQPPIQFTMNLHCSANNLINNSFVVF